MVYVLVEIEIVIAKSNLNHITIKLTLVNNIVASRKGLLKVYEWSRDL